MNAVLRELFKLVKSLGGTISGEHGIGLIQKTYMDIVFEQRQIQLMREIKKPLIPIIFSMRAKYSTLFK